MRHFEVCTYEIRQVRDRVMSGAHQESTGRQAPKIGRHEGQGVSHDVDQVRDQHCGSPSCADKH